jgi:hypothetical protein
MLPTRLLSLRLAAPLPYRACEPSSQPGRSKLPAESEARTDLAEGAESLEIHEPSTLIIESADGPRLPALLPPPDWRGVALEGRSIASTGSDVRELAAGTYLFTQWRPADEEELRAGLEWFLREAWWEGTPGTGPVYLRRVFEDGRLATQALRRP